MTRRSSSAPATACPAIIADRRTAVAALVRPAYSRSIETLVNGPAMNLTLGVRILLILALVTAATVVLVHPALGGDHPALDALLVLARS